MIYEVDMLVSQGIGLLLVVPSVPLYCLQCAVIVANWEPNFNSSFYKLFLVSALNVSFL
jgi:hypothetical protein